MSSEVVAKAIIRKAEEIQQQQRDTQADPTAKYKPLPKLDYDVHKWSSSLVNKETAPSPKYGEQGICVQNEVVDNVCSKVAEVDLTVPTKQESGEQCKPNCQQYTPLREAYRPLTDQYRGSCEQPRSTSEQQQYKFNENVAGRTEQLLEHQTPLTKQLINHQVKTMLPQTKIPIYAGDPLDYANFIRAFEFGVEEKTEDPQDRLYHLVQHTTGQAQGLVKSCLHLPKEQSYIKAKELLNKQFGNKHKVADAVMQKAKNWKEIKAEDGEALRAFSIFLNETGGGRKRLPKFKFSAKFPVGLHVILQIQIKKIRK